MRHISALCILLVFTCANAAQLCVPADVDYCFSPHGNCANLITKSISAAKKQILVQAYTFTSKEIINALIAAKKRGVDVQILLDKVNKNNKVTPLLLANNIPVKIDYLPAIAHNKVMIIDKQTVITGSYNFTQRAETRNAENLLVIHSPSLADAYVKNWGDRGKASMRIDSI